MRRLSTASLAAVDGAVPVPAYDRSRVSAGILHVGVGGFHRAHEAVYVDQLLHRRQDSWAICGVGVLPADRRMHAVLEAQDHLYSLFEKWPTGEVRGRVVGSIVGHLMAPDDPGGVVERLADPATRIVSLTITEGGYQVDLAGRRFLPTEPAVRLDLQPGAVPQTVFGLLAAGLARRRARGVPPFTVVSCDNIPGNGSLAREAFAGFASRLDPGLGDWIREHVAFPSSMVDRITPVTTPDDVELADARLGVHDDWPVVCEPYQQWVLEDDFPAGRPGWEDVGVSMVPDVAPYEAMKLRLLNAGHQAIGYLGYLAGYRTTDEVCADPLFRRFLLDYLEYEASPTLPPVPGVDLQAYRSSLLERFGNRHVRDTLARLCAESSDRIPTFVLPVIRDRLRKGGAITRATLVVAAWARYSEGRDEGGCPIAVVDRLLEAVRAAAGRAAAEPAAFLTDVPVFGELARDPHFVDVFTEQLRSLQRHGARATLQGLPAPHA